MRIAIDGRTIVKGRSGIGKYADRITRSLLEVDHVNEYFLFLTEPNDEIDAPNLKRILIEGYHRVGLNRWWENVLFPRFSSRFGINVLFSPANHLPMWPRRAHSRLRTRYVATIHDVITDVLPEMFTPKLRFWQRIFNANAVRVADELICVSQSTATDFVRIYGKPRGNLTVIHSSVERWYLPVEDKKVIETVRSRYRLPDTYVLFVGTVEPRKNVARLAKAYSLLPADLRGKYPLVLVGADGWYSEDILREISSFKLGSSLIRLGYVDEKDLPSIYTLAAVFVFPSLYEGFGYPPLEAMSCGTPVISSSSSSIPEVVGDKGILVDPFQVEALSAELERVLRSEELQNQLRINSLNRARNFDWHTTAQRTLEVLSRGR